MNTKLSKYLLLLQVCLFLATAHAQPGFNYPAANAAITSFMSYRNWRIRQGGQEKKISQMVFPLSILRPLGEHVDLLFSASNASAIFDSDSKYNLNGLTDGKLKLSWRLAENSILLNMGLSLPYGNNAFTPEECQVANYLYETIFGFSAKRYGEGLDLDLGAIYAKSFKEYFTFGAGMGYLLKGEYEYLQDYDNKFQPGNVFSIQGGLNIEIDSIFVRADMLYSVYGSDKLDGEKFLTEGDQLEIETLFLYQAHPFVFTILLKDIIKQENEIIGDVGASLMNGHNFIRNIFLSRIQFIYNVNQQFSFGGKFGLNKFGESDIQLSDAWTIQSGIELYTKFSEFMLMRTEFLYLTGEAESNTIKLNGWQFGLGISLRF